MASPASDPHPSPAFPQLAAGVSVDPMILRKCEIQDSIPDENLSKAHEVMNRALPQATGMSRNPSNQSLDVELLVKAEGLMDGPRAGGGGNGGSGMHSALENSGSQVFAGITPVPLSEITASMPLGDAKQLQSDSLTAEMESHMSMHRQMLTRRDAQISQYEALASAQSEREIPGRWREGGTEGWRGGRRKKRYPLARRDAESRWDETHTICKVQDSAWRLSAEPSDARDPVDHVVGPDIRLFPIPEAFARARCFPACEYGRSLVKGSEEAASARAHVRGALISIPAGLRKQLGMEGRRSQGRAPAVVLLQGADARNLS
eukprot:scaffold977_cov253-Pinguiococcus_pyrenoidosus.AAC.43